MSQEMVVLQGNCFKIELQSMYGSTNYAWCLTGLPEGIVLLGTETEPTAGGIAPVIQRFWFGAASQTEGSMEIKFAMVRMSDVFVTDQKHTVSVTIIPSNSEEFARYSENEAAVCGGAADVVQDYGYIPNASPIYAIVNTPPNYNTSNMTLFYGYPCGAQDAVVKYGYPCGVQDATVKYGYPCGAQDAVMKYGYPCGVQDATVKYGYPCGVQNVVFKYGYPGCC